jgi:hypothetical protein
VEPRRAKLVALAGSGPAAARERGPRRAGAGLSRREWGLVALLALAALALGVLSLRARHLEARLGVLAGELARSESRLEAHREHLRAVRGGVAALREELSALDALVAVEPEAEASAP